MAESTDRYGMLYQNLIDCGLDEAAADRCAVQLMGEGRAAAVRHLRAHRRRLLDVVHENQKRIDCLDFLVYAIERETRRNSS